jgi:hypothetical protein
VRRLRRVIRSGLGVLIVGSVIGVVPASADTLSGFVGNARAAGMRMSYDIPGFLVVEKLIDGGGPVAEATVDALGSGGFASLPFPGENGIAFGSLLAAGTGRDAPASYPFYVSARNPGSPSSELSDPSGFYRLAAKADSGTATAEARMARPGNDISGGSTSTASVGSDGQTVTATAVSHSEGISLAGGALKIALVESRSVTKYTAGDAAPVTTKSLLIQGGSAGGTAFSVGPGGMLMGGASAPIPFGDGLAQLNKGLAPSGLSMGFAQGREAGAIDAFEVGLTHAVPGVAGDVQGHLRIRFGETTTSVAAEGLGAPSVVEAKPATAGQAPIGSRAQPGGDPAAAPDPATASAPALTGAATGVPRGRQVRLPSVSFQGTLLAPAKDRLAGRRETVPPVDATGVTSGGGDTLLASAPLPEPAALHSVPAAARSMLAPVGSAKALGWVLAALGLIVAAVALAFRGKGAARWTS